MKILLLGSGGREHAIAKKIAESPQLEKLFISPGNSGTKDVGENVNLSMDGFQEVQNFVDEHSIDMIIVGPEQALVDGIVDYFQNHPVKVVGPSKEAAQLEGSKQYAKEFMKKFGIPTAAYQSFDASNLEEGFQFLSTLKPPYVLKADGLAGGKGVLILNELEEAKTKLKEMLVESKFGAAGNTVVIEEFLDGIEMSVFVLTDGNDYKILPEAKDYKRIGENDTGLNTGGMGAVSPVPFADKELLQKIEKKIIQPSINGIKRGNLNYKGFLFIGLMIVNKESYVIEYNVRMGDPETEVVMPRVQSDLLELLSSLFDGSLSSQELLIDNDFATTVMLVSKGYPEAYKKGKEIQGLDKTQDCILFHCGTKTEAGKILTNGGRVIAITAKGNSMKAALSNSYKNAEKVDFEGKYYRKDIGWDLK